jgi:NADH-quinone oxidoreductase subunit M
MILTWLIIVPTGGGILAWLLSRWYPAGPRWIALLALAINLILTLTLLGNSSGQFEISSAGPWLAEINQPWISQLGTSFHLAIDGLSLVLVLLTVFLGLAAVASAWTEIGEHVGFFYFNLMWVLAGITGVFLTLDLFLFYFFWEMMLVPMYFIIAIWGHENRIYAATKFFLFTQISGLLMLVAIIGLYFVHGRSSGVYTFDYLQLLGTAIPAPTAMVLMLGFLIAFVVKLPAFPVHTWLPDAHTEAPTPGSVILAGLLLKTGAYGLVRFVVPLFPQAASDFAPIAIGLGIVGILYGALLAFSQTDLKRLVAYTSISHMGFVLLGVFVWNELALQGVVMQIICHGISTGALFILVGALQERIHTRDLRRMGGLRSAIPRLAGVTLIFALASLGLPGMGNFVAEILILLGTYQVSIPAAVAAAVGLVSATIYALWMVQLTFHGPDREGWKLPDLSGREAALMGVMITVILWLGLYPQPFLDTTRPVLRHLEQTATVRQMSAAAKARLIVKPDSGKDPLDQADLFDGGRL